MFWDVKAKIDRAQILFILYSIFFLPWKKSAIYSLLYFFHSTLNLTKAIYTIFESITRICFSKV